MNEIGRKEHSFLFVPLKSQIFILRKLGGIEGHEIWFYEFFTKNSKIPLYIQPFILK